MDIILPAPTSDRVWIHAPTTLYSHWIWVMPVVAGIAFTVASIALRRQGYRSVTASLVLFFSIASIVVGSVMGVASALFSAHPRPVGTHTSWSNTADAEHNFEIDADKLTSDFTPPARDRASETRRINDWLAQGFAITALHPGDEPTFTSKDISGEAMREKAKHASPWLINNEVYTCAFDTTEFTRDPSGLINRVNTVSATCVRGDVAIVIRPVRD